MKKALPFLFAIACAPVLVSDGVEFIPPAEAQSAAAPTQMGYLTTSCTNRPSPCFEQYGPVLPIAGSFSASVTVSNPTIGDPVPADANYVAAEGSTGNLEGLLLDASRNLNVNCVVGCAGGTFTNGTDNVTASADNGKTAAWVYLWDGTAYDMWRGNAAGGAFVQGPAADDAAIAGNPNAMGCKNETTLNQVEDGDVSWLKCTTRGETYVALSVNGSLLTLSSSPTDDVSNAGNMYQSLSKGYLFDGSTWDRWPGNSTDGALVNLGANNDVTVTSGTVTASQGGTWTVQPGNTQNTTPWLTSPSASTGAVGSTRCSVTSFANSENETNCKDGAGVAYGFNAYNTTTTALYLTLYNAHSGAVCGTSEVETHVIPGNAAGAGVVVNFPVPVAFSTGISYCISTGADGTGAVPTASGSANLYYQ